MCHLGPRRRSLGMVPANSTVVTTTPFLDWQPAAAAPGGAAQVQLATFQAVKAFMPGCKISRLAPDQNAAAAVHLLEVRMIVCPLAFVPAVTTLRVTAVHVCARRSGGAGPSGGPPP